MKIKGVESVLCAFYFGVTANGNVYKCMFFERNLRFEM
ncbi:hypothetical protein BTJ45_03811 [Bacillus mycoides]|nr:hypothetical protein BTJ45_03811 [Bacillus mycoides]